MAESLLQLGGAQPPKPYKNVPLTTSVFFSGIWTQRSPFGSPDGRYYTRALGGRTDILIDGLNTELTNYGTLIRRPGITSFSTAVLDSGAINFYSFQPIGMPLSIIADSSAKVYTLNSTTATSIFTKSSGAGQTYFQGVGNTLYMGNGIDQKAYPNGGSTRNWGIALSGGFTGPDTAGLGTSDGSGPVDWTNPNNVTSAVSDATSSLTAVQTVTSHLLATQFGFALPINTITGIQVTFVDDSTKGGFSVQLLKGGLLTGSAKIMNITGGGSTVTLGGNSDLWGGSFSYNDVNQATFGVSIQGINLNPGFPGGGGNFAVRNVQITVFTAAIGGPVVALVAGTLTATTGFQYRYAYYNSTSGDVSNPTPPSALIKPVAQGVQISLIASTDPQVTGIRVFRTKDGGTGDYFELPTSPFANSTGTITDNAPDSTLQLLNFFTAADPFLANSPPPSGFVKMTYHLNRIWGIVGNNVYYSALLGDEITLGVGAECFPPSNVFVFPTTVNKLVPTASGLLVFATDNVYIIVGSTPVQFFSQLFQQGLGLLSYNALDVEGNQIFLYSSDRQFLSFTASGPNEIGFPIGVDLQNNFNPSSVYVASLISGTQDKAVFIADGSSSWYRCNWNQPPEGGPAWSPKANITGGITSIVTVETSPGVHQMLIGQSNGTVLVRNYSVYSDNGSAYQAFATIGSLILAKPGQLAALNNIILELQQVGSVPTLSLLLDEISGPFNQLNNSVFDPPMLDPSQTVMSRRWYLSQSPISAYCRHIQIKISFPSEAAKNEVLTVTAVGALLNEE